jgi:hypothetical protein
VINEIGALIDLSFTGSIEMLGEESAPVPLAMSFTPGAVVVNKLHTSQNKDSFYLNI